ncbi:hypothetical protein Athai_46480 [Actinocatenispora thailandica]|uniref:Uncharacterized protein n=1 Tax=Actinocatenispora thailandica TaxID=227318 RepID=A0A7R7DT23_9ACTN|nr:hypothetical protein [Actinocatenispora thailandica]BCJ37145.1 hypothetical protein Athai_46480 [Actinocatenispora thailandica]
MSLISQLAVPTAVVASLALLIVWDAIHDDALTHRLDTLLRTVLTTVETCWLASRRKRRRNKRH